MSNTVFLPPEWAPQSAVMLTWPRRDGDFADWFDDVEANFFAIAAAITRYADVHINVAGDVAALRARLHEHGVAPARLHLFEVPNDDVWARDHGPITVVRDGQLVHLDFRFNGWGNKFAHANDDALTGRLAALGAWSAPVQSVDFVLEGGGIEVDGRGSLLTTERCLLAKTRNPYLDRHGIENTLKDLLGIERVLWLAHGDLLGDDTDGHIDTLARFCSADTIAYQACADRLDAHFEPLAAMEAELRALTQPNGQPYRLVPLPLPTPIYDERRRLPAGYANFLILNGAVLVPVYGDDTDALALRALRNAFPYHELVPVNCRALIHQYGSLHCVTMQLPQRPVAPVAAS